MIYILHNIETSKYLEFYKSIEPLEFDDADLVSMIKSFKNDLLKQEHISQLDCLYEEIKNKKDRFEFLDLIGNEMFYFSEEEEEDE